MAKKKEEIEKIPIDFDRVLEEIREPEEIRLSNIFEELNFKPGTPPEELTSASGCWEDRDKYYQYLRWLREHGKSEWDFR